MLSIRCSHCSSIFTHWPDWIRALQLFLSCMPHCRTHAVAGRTFTYCTLGSRRLGEVMRFVDANYRCDRHLETTEKIPTQLTIKIIIIIINPTAANKINNKLALFTTDHTIHLQFPVLLFSEFIRSFRWKRNKWEPYFSFCRIAIRNENNNLQ